MKFCFGVFLGFWFFFFLPESVKSYPNSRGRRGRGKTNAVFDVRYFSPGEVTLERRGRQGLRARVL